MSGWVTPNGDGDGEGDGDDEVEDDETWRTMLERLGLYDVEEREDLSRKYVGRVIGKGGEMIRDLQARSGCRIDVDQDVPPGAPFVVVYRGPRRGVDFAKRLVGLLCSESWKGLDLPLGEAIQRRMAVPSHVIGKVIGKRGEMIRTLQSRSEAKIQVGRPGVSGVDRSQRRVTITGTEDGVAKAEEMILFLCANPQMEAMAAINMLRGEKLRGDSQWLSRPLCSTELDSEREAASAASRGREEDKSEIFLAPKMHMGRIIGKKGVTINDLQRRSGCHIQYINRDAPHDEKCEISLTGPQRGIEMAKQMLSEIIMSSHHPYAGGIHALSGEGRGGQRYTQQHQGNIWQQEQERGYQEQQPRTGPYCQQWQQSFRGQLHLQGGYQQLQPPQHLSASRYMYGTYHNQHTQPTGQQPAIYGMQRQDAPTRAPTKRSRPEKRHVLVMNGPL